MRRPRLRTIQFLLQIGFFGLLIATAVLISVSNISVFNNHHKSGLRNLSNTANVPSLNHFKIGLFIDKPNVLPDEKNIGTKLNILGWFVHWNESMKSSKIKSACDNGYVPEITWESWNGKAGGFKKGNYTLSDIAQGKYDALIKQQLQIINTQCNKQTVIIRFDHEMNTPKGVLSYYPWQGNATEYISAWQRIVGLSRTIDPNIKWLWSVRRGMSQASQYFPGDQWVDYVGITFDRGPNQIQIPDFATFYDQNKTILESFGKPIIISETSDEEGPDTDSKAIWITGMFNYIEKDPRITALVWFNAVKTYRYDSSPITLKAFSQGISNIQSKEK